jgi:hypothetical protein
MYEYTFFSQSGKKYRFARSQLIPREEQDRIMRDTNARERTGGKPASRNEAMLDQLTVWKPQRPSRMQVKRVGPQGSVGVSLPATPEEFQAFGSKPGDPSVVPAQARGQRAAKQRPAGGGTGAGLAKGTGTKSQGTPEQIVQEMEWIKRAIRNTDEAVNRGKSLNPTEQRQYQRRRERLQRLQKLDNAFLTQSINAGMKAAHDRAIVAEYPQEQAKQAREREKRGEADARSAYRAVTDPQKASLQDWARYFDVTRAGDPQTNHEGEFATDYGRRREPNLDRRELVPVGPHGQKRTTVNQATRMIYRGAQRGIGAPIISVPGVRGVLGFAMNKNPEDPRNFGDMAEAAGTWATSWAVGEDPMEFLQNMFLEPVSGPLLHLLGKGTKAAERVARRTQVGKAWTAAQAMQSATRGGIHVAERPTMVQRGISTVGRAAEEATPSAMMRREGRIVIDPTVTRGGKAAPRRAAASAPAEIRVPPDPRIRYARELHREVEAAGGWWKFRSAGGLNKGGIAERLANRLRLPGAQARQMADYVKQRVLNAESKALSKEAGVSALRELKETAKKGVRETVEKLDGGHLRWLRGALDDGLEQAEGATPRKATYRQVVQAAHDSIPGGRLEVRVAGGEPTVRVRASGRVHDHAEVPLTVAEKARLAELAEAGEDGLRVLDRPEFDALRGRIAQALEETDRRGFRQGDRVVDLRAPQQGEGVVRGEMGGSYVVDFGEDLGERIVGFADAKGVEPIHLSGGIGRIPQFHPAVERAVRDALGIAAEDPRPLMDLVHRRIGVLASLEREQSAKGLRTSEHFSGYGRTPDGASVEWGAGWDRPNLTGLGQRQRSPWSDLRRANSDPWGESVESKANPIKKGFRREVHSEPGEPTGPTEDWVPGTVTHLEPFHPKDFHQAVEDAIRDVLQYRSEKMVVLNPDGTRYTILGYDNKVQIPDHLEFVEGSVSVHNHPKGGPFSHADLRNILSGPRRTSIVATRNGRYKVTKVERVSIGDWSFELYRINKALAKQRNERILAGNPMSPEEEALFFWHEATLRSRSLGIEAVKL